MTDNLIEKLNAEAKYLQICLPYDKDDHLITFDDGMMTELECEEDFTPPMLNTEDLLLVVVVDLEKRKVLDWNYEEGYLRMWAKVCDGGSYTLLDKDRNPLWQIKGYVPNKLIPPFEKGFGDYIELAIEPDGTIRDWPATPDFSEFVENGQTPQPVSTNKWYRAERALMHVYNEKLTKEEIAWLIEELKRKLN